MTDKKQEFGRLIYRLMLSKSMRQSDLARAADLDRARISSYVRGDSLPTPLHMKKLADALGVKLTDLDPDAMSDEAPPLYSTATSSDGKKMRLICDVWVPVGIGAQVIQLFAEHATAHG
jgi:transcriptional regulator with XRE-family HTH domain